MTIDDRPHHHPHRPAHPGTRSRPRGHQGPPAGHLGLGRLRPHRRPPPGRRRAAVRGRGPRRRRARPGRRGRQRQRLARGRAPQRPRDVSTDYVPDLLEQGRRRADADRLPIAFQHADAEALPFPDASVRRGLERLRHDVRARPGADGDRAAAGGPAGRSHRPGQLDAGGLPGRPVPGHRPLRAAARGRPLADAVGLRGAHRGAVRRGRRGHPHHAPALHVPVRVAGALHRHVPDLVRPDPPRVRGAGRGRRPGVPRRRWRRCSGPPIAARAARSPSRPSTSRSWSRVPDGAGAVRAAARSCPPGRASRPGPPRHPSPRRPGPTPA